MVRMRRRSRVLWGRSRESGNQDVSVLAEREASSCRYANFACKLFDDNGKRCISGWMELGAFLGQEAGESRKSFDQKDKLSLTKRWSQCLPLSRIVLAHDSRHRQSWLTFDVRHNEGTILETRGECP